jgi:peptide/nickel transport system permease protein
MGQFVLRRIAVAIPLMLLVTLAAFSLTWLLPGDAAYAIGGIDATPEEIAYIRDRLDLDQPFYERYGRWVGDAVQGDFGTSALTEQSVTAEIKRRVPITASIAIGALVMATVVGAAIGLLQGAFPGRWPDRILLAVVSGGLAMPGFWLATLLVSFFAVRWQWFPSVGYTSLRDSPTGWFRHAFLPMVTLAVVTWSEVARQLRTGLVDVLDQDYIRAAQARGLSRTRVMGKHALKNAALPTITILGVRLGLLIAGSVIVESIFGIPGLGAYALAAIQSHDVPVIQAVVVVSAAAVITLSVIVDIAYGFLNPKVKVA